MKRTIFCPVSSCEHPEIIEIDEKPRVIGCDKCGQPQTVFVVRAGKIIRFRPLSFLFPTPLDGPWERICWWPADQDVLNGASATKFEEQPHEPNMCWIHKDGTIEESITMVRASEIMRERFGGLSGKLGSSLSKMNSAASSESAKNVAAPKPWWKFWGA